MKITHCKRCDAKDVYWAQNNFGKWVMRNATTHEQHSCEDGNLKAVKCKYCNSNDLHWAEEINPETKAVKHILTESYGLPHACDERIAFIAKEKKEKSDKYEAEKNRIAKEPEGKCTKCFGTGYFANKQPGSHGICLHCEGHGQFNERTRQFILAAVRRRIWPHMKENTRRYGRKY